MAKIKRLRTFSWRFGRKGASHHESSLDYHPCETNSSSQLKIGGHKEDSFCECFLVPGIRAVFVSGSPGTVHRVDLRGPGSGRVRFGTWRNIVVGAHKLSPKELQAAELLFLDTGSVCFGGAKKQRVRVCYMSPFSISLEWTKRWRPYPAKQNAVPGSAETSESDSGKVRFTMGEQVTTSLERENSAAMKNGAPLIQLTWNHWMVFHVLVPPRNIPNLRNGSLMTLTDLTVACKWDKWQWVCETRQLRKLPRRW